MNFQTIIICLFLIALYVLAIRYIAKNGTCAGCSEKVSCSTGCSGVCASCHGCQAKPQKVRR